MLLVFFLFLWEYANRGVISRKSLSEIYCREMETSQLACNTGLNVADQKDEFKSSLHIRFRHEYRKKNILGNSTIEPKDLSG